MNGLSRRLGLTALVVIGLVACSSREPPSDPTTAVATSPAPDPSWTGLTQPKAVITARLELMEHIEELMEPIDTITIQTGPVKDVPRLHQSAEVIGAMLGALPHLFPPTTNLYDPQSLTPQTIALPAIWKDFDSFYRLAQASSAAAERFAKTEGDEPLREASRALRSSCDGCHALYLRKYVPPEVLESDRAFDFDSALGRR